MTLRHKHAFAIFAFLAFVLCLNSQAQADTSNFTYTVTGNANAVQEGSVLRYSFVQTTNPSTPLGVLTVNYQGSGFDFAKPNADGTVTGLTTTIYTIGGDKFLGNGTEFVGAPNAQGVAAFFGSTTITGGTGIFAGATGRAAYTGTFNVVTGVVSFTETVTLFAPGLRAPACTLRTVSGTYGYRMTGSIVGVGPFLVNGLFTHNPDGTSSAAASVTINGQFIPASAGTTTGGKFAVNSDCTGAGEFFSSALNLQVTYKFIATEGGAQIELLNTNAGVVLEGYGRRISEAGRAPSCSISNVVGNYGYRLAGSLPDVPNVAAAGLVEQSAGEGGNGVLVGKDGVVFNGELMRRQFQGTFKINSDCTGAGVYTDTLGNTINFIFVAVDGGAELFVQGTDPGVNISGVLRRQ